MLSGSEARNTGLPITAHVRTFCCGFVEKNMDIDSVLEVVLLVRGQGNLKLKQKQKEALQAIVVNGQDCLIVLPTGYGKSLIYQMLPLLFDKTNLSLNVTSEGKSIVIVVFSFKCLN